MTSTQLPSVTQDHAYWLGWLSTAVRETILHLETVDHNGEPLMTREQAAGFAREMLDPYIESEIGQTLQPGFGDRMPAGYVIESADGEAQAFRETFDEIPAAMTTVESYWWEAAGCGHPSAPGFVAKLRPFTIRQVTRAERDELSEYPPVTDREP